MYDFLKSPAVDETKTLPPVTEELSHACAASNQAAVDGMAASTDDSWFGGLLDFDGSSTTMSPMASASGPSEMKRDLTLADHGDLLKMPTKVPVGGAASVGPAGFDLGSKQGGGEGRSSTTDSMNVDLAKKKVALSTTIDTPASGGAAKQSRGGFVSGDANGKFEAGFSQKVGEQGGSVHGMIDFDDKGSVQALGVGAKAEMGKYGVGADVAAQTGVVGVEGSTVSQVYGLQQGMSGKLGAVELGSGMGGSYSQSMTFANAADAEAYGEEVGKGAARNAGSLTAQDLLELPEGTRASYVLEAKAQLASTFIAKVGASGGASYKVDIGARQGDVVTMTVEIHGDVGGELGLDNGMMGAGKDTRWTEDRKRVYAIDLADPGQAAAFELFQRTGFATGLTLVSDEALNGSTSTSKAHGPMLESTEASERSSGTRTDENGTVDIERGGYTNDAHNGWNFDVAMGAFTNWYGGDQKQAPPAYDNEFEDQISGNENGTSQGRTDVYTNQETGSSTALQTQKIDFDDRHQNARYLRDQMDPMNDQLGLDAAGLPGHANTDRAWTLESQVDEFGVANIGEMLASDKGLPCEDVGSTNAWTASREAYQGSDRSPGALGSAIADASMQGEDALECGRKMAGEEHVEQFLSLAGDSNWMSSAEHRALDRQISELEANDEIQRADLRATLRMKLEALASTAYPEAPQALRDAETVRIRAHLTQLGDR